MTIQTFIVNYNYTFIYLHEHFGKSDVVDLWKKLAAESTDHLRKNIEAKGLRGAFEHFYGEDGIANREHVHADAGYTEDHYFENVVDCPSPNEMVKRDKKRYRYYCEHCYWLYAPCFEDNGFTYDVKYDFQGENAVGDCCHIVADRKKTTKAKK